MYWSPSCSSCAPHVGADTTFCPDGYEPVLLNGVWTGECKEKTPLWQNLAIGGGVGIVGIVLLRMLGVFK